MSTSPRRLLWLCIGWLIVAAIVMLSLVPVPMPPQQGGDKTGHVIAYAVAMFWFTQLYARGRWRLAAALLVMGCTLEVIQSHVGRSFEYADMAADAIGIALAWIVAPPRSPHVVAALDALLDRKERLKGS